MLASSATLLLGAFYLVSQVAGANAISPSKIETFLKQCETNRRGAILQLEFKLRGLRNQRPMSPQVSAQINSVEEDLRILRANQHLVVPTLAFPPEIGSIGRLPRLRLHVDQIVSESEFLGRVFFPVKMSEVRQFRWQPNRVAQELTFLIRGVPTKGLNEGVDTEFDQVFEIVGRRSSRTRDGQLSPLWVANSFDMTEVNAIFQRQRDSVRPVPRTP
jgi:hypothetical protein